MSREDDEVRAWYREHHGCTCEPAISRLEDPERPLILVDTFHDEDCPAHVYELERRRQMEAS